MSVDENTKEFYDENAEDYADFSTPAGPTARLTTFLDQLPSGGCFLDLGCGSGWAAKFANARGFETHAIDPTPGLVEQARQLTKLNVLLGTIGDFAWTDFFDGIWASYSLLHEPRETSHLALAKIAEAIKIQGILFLGLEEGEGRVRDSLGRLYERYTEAELKDMLSTAGFEIVDISRAAAQKYDESPMQVIEIVARKNG